MARRRKRKYLVTLSPHAGERSVERAHLTPERLQYIASQALKERLRIGLPVVDGRAMLLLDGRRLGLQYDIVVILALDGLDQWHVRTVMEAIPGSKVDRELRAAQKL
jgi:hypothetical protein